VGRAVITSCAGCAGLAGCAGWVGKSPLLAERTPPAERTGPFGSACAQGLTLVGVRAQLEQLQDTFRVTLGYTVDRRAQVELKSERV